MTLSRRIVGWGSPIVSRLPRSVKRIARAAIGAAGYEIVATSATAMGTQDMEPAFLELYEELRPYTMTSVERMHALYQAVTYVVKAGIAGDFVECGVWKGGSAMLAARTLGLLGSVDRNLYLYDTYAGMTAPVERDVDWTSARAGPTWQRLQHDSYNEWCFAPLTEVRENLAATGYPSERVHFIEGRVEDTLPGTAPEAIAILRLDTDWYESTAHELSVLYPRVTDGGILIVDDYGYWRGQREAVDEYFQRTGISILLQRIDGCGRIGLVTRAGTNA